MSDTCPLGFEAFLTRHTSDFGRIARASRGEWQADDVRGEAWTLAFDLGRKRGRPFDLDRPDDASLLVRCLHNHCVKYGETVVRYATRLDHASSGDDERGQHWLMDRLVSDDGAHPLSLLEAVESAVDEPEPPDPYHSSAAAWVRLLQRFGQRVPDVAAYLLISVSWCYQCCRRAHRLAVSQAPLPYALAVGDDPNALRPWRAFKLPPSRSSASPRQMGFDYWARPRQPERGQLWLL